MRRMILTFPGAPSPALLASRGYASTCSGEEATSPPMRLFASIGHASKSSLKVRKHRQAGGAERLNSESGLTSRCSVDVLITMAKSPNLEPVSSGKRSNLARIAPGLDALLRYDPADFNHDLIAGLSVACVAAPVGVAYAQLAGFNPAVGLYSSILPLVAYAIFGTSRQLIVGPDAATCALVAAAVAPLAAGDQKLYLSLS